MSGSRAQNQPTAAKPSANEFFRTLGRKAAFGTLMVTGLAGTVQYIANSTNSVSLGAPTTPFSPAAASQNLESANISLEALRRSSAPISRDHSPNTRRFFLEEIFTQVSPEYLTHIVYDPDGTQRQAYFTQRLIELQQGVVLGHLVLPHYETSIFTHNNEIGNGKPSILFVGTMLFNKNYSANDWQNVIARGNHYARIQAKGFEGIDSTKLVAQIVSGHIPLDFVAGLREFETDMHGLMHPSAPLMSDIAKNDLAVKLRTYMQGFEAADLNETSREIINRVYERYNLPVPASRAKPLPKFYIPSGGNKSRPGTV